MAAMIALIAWSATRVDWQAIGHQLASTSLVDQAAMAVCWLAALFVRPFRQLALMKAMAPEIHRRYGPVWSADLIGMATNNILPMRAGELVIVFVLRQKMGLNIARGSSLVLVDRFCDFATVIGIFVSMLLLAPAISSWADRAATALVLVVLGLVVAATIVNRLHRWGQAWLERIIDRVIPSRSDRLKTSIRDLLSGFRAIATGHVLIRTILLSICLWSLISLSFWLGIRAMWPSAPLAAGAFAAASVSLSFVLPFVPGGVGVVQGAAVLALSLYGVPTATALAFAIVAHGFQLASVLVCAIVAAGWQDISIKSMIAARDAVLSTPAGAP